MRQYNATMQCYNTMLQYNASVQFIKHQITQFSTNGGVAYEGSILQYKGVTSCASRKSQVASRSTDGSWRRVYLAAGVGNDVVVCHKLPDRVGLNIHVAQ